MNKRLAAGALAVVTSASVLGIVGATPAQAATCGEYPPGQTFQISRAPGSASVVKGAVVSLRGTLRRGGEPCAGVPLGIYVKNADQSIFRRKGSAITSTTGSIHPSLVVDQTLRFFFNLNAGEGGSFQSGITQFVVVNP